MAVDATPSQSKPCGKHWRRPDITSLRYLDHAAAFEEFKRIFSDQPALIQSTTADVLPVSFRLEVRKGADPETVATRYGSASGIDEILTPATNCD